MSRMVHHAVIALRPMPHLDIHQALTEGLARLREDAADQETTVDWSTLRISVQPTGAQGPEGYKLLALHISAYPVQAAPAGNHPTPDAAARPVSGGA